MKKALNNQEHLEVYNNFKKCFELLKNVLELNNIVDISSLKAIHEELLIEAKNLKQILKIENTININQLLVFLRHIMSLLHNIHIEKGLSVFDKSNFTELQMLLDNLYNSLVPHEDLGNAVDKQDRGTILPRQDNISREYACFQEQKYYEENRQFHELLNKIWKYTLKNQVRSKTIFISYAWPNANELNEAWTKEFVQLLARHLCQAGMCVYLDETHSGPGFKLGEFMQKIQKVDHVLVISSRTMGLKLKKDNSGVSYEHQQIKDCLTKYPHLDKKLFVIPVLCNYANYVHDDFKDYAEASICANGYFNTFIKLIMQTYGLGNNFERWLHEKLHESNMIRMYHLPQMPELLIQRTHLIEQLRKAYEERPKENQASNIAMKIILSGLPGVGKTTLARLYCEMQYYHQVYWFQAESLQNAYLELAQELSLNKSNNDNTFTEIANYFEAKKNTLIVIDGVRNEIALKRINEILPKTGVDILITTRANILGYTQIQVNSLLQSETKEYIETKLATNLQNFTDKQIEKMIHLSYCHPAQCEQLCNYIILNKIPLWRFFSIYQNQKLHVLSQTGLTYRGEKKSIKMVFNDYLDFIEPGSMIEKIINLLSCFAGFLISRENLKIIMLQIQGIDNDDIEEAIETLISHSLVQVNKDLNFISLPSFIFAMIWDRLPEVKKQKNLELLYGSFGNHTIKDENLLAQLMKKSEDFFCTATNINDLELQLPIIHILRKKYIQQSEITLAILIEASLVRLHNVIKRRNGNIQQHSLIKFKQEIGNENNTKQTEVPSGTYQKDLTLLGYIPIISDKKLKSPKNPKLHNLPESNPNFVGRESILTKLKEQLQATILTENKSIVISACKGLGGVGKSQIAIEFAYRYQQNYANIFWISVKNENSIVSAYREIASNFQLLSDDSNEDELLKVVKKWLEVNPGNLLIFDNAQDYNSLQEFLPASGNSILITSRKSDWPSNEINIDVFDLDEAMKYINKVLGNRKQDTIEMKEKLAKRLGCLPLALAQAVAYIYQRHISIEDYLKRYEANSKRILEYADLPLPTEHESVFVTWDISRQQIETISPLANKLLNACAYLHYNAIPGFLLENLSSQPDINEGSEVFEEAIGILYRYSLINIDLNRYSINLHEVLHTVLNIQVKEMQVQNKNLEPLVITMGKFMDELVANDPYDFLANKIHPHSEYLLIQFENNEDISLEILKILPHMANNLINWYKWKQEKANYYIQLTERYNEMLQDLNDDQDEGLLLIITRVTNSQATINRSAVLIQNKQYEETKSLLEPLVIEFDTFYPVFNDLFDANINSLSEEQKAAKKFLIDLYALAYINLGTAHNGIYITNTLHCYNNGIDYNKPELVQVGINYIKKGLAVLENYRDDNDDLDIIQAKLGLIEAMSSCPDLSSQALPIIEQLRQKVESSQYNGHFIKSLVYFQIGRYYYTYKKGNNDVSENYIQLAENEAHQYLSVLHPNNEGIILVNDVLQQIEKLRQSMQGSRSPSFHF